MAWKAKRNIWISLLLSGLLLAGCSNTVNSEADKNSTTQAVATDSTTTTNGEEQVITGSSDGLEAAAGTVVTEAEMTALMADVSALLDTTDDHYVTDLSGAVTISLTGDSATVSGSGAKVSGSTVTITAAGTYVIEGDLEGQIIVNAADQKVNLVFSGLSVTSTSGPALWVQDADKVFITLAADTTNTLEDKKAGSDSDADAALYSVSDLSITGEGTFTVNGNVSDGIKTKDDLNIRGGLIQVTAVDDGIVGHDSLEMTGGMVVVDAGGDGLASKQEDTAALGWITISAGAVWINSGDDGMHAEGIVTIEGGNVLVSSSYEGIEGSTIIMTDGNVTVYAEDDGLNSAGGTSEENSWSFQGSSGDYNITISGGSLYVYADGDGIDSNGSITMTGGIVYVFGPERSDNGALDYQNTFTLTGGTLMATGSSGMAETATSAEQPVFLVNFDSTISAGTIISVVDENGNALLTYEADKSIQSLTFSSDLLTVGDTYTIYTDCTYSSEGVGGVYSGGTVTLGSKLTTVTLSDTITSSGGSGFGSGGGGFGGGGNSGGGRGNSGFGGGRQ